MTALQEYAQLESGGLWRETPDAQRRDVGLSFGDATLVITDSVGRPLAHWSFPAIVRLNPGKMPALFSPDPDAHESVEISDDLMIEALEKVRRVVERAQPRPGRLRTYGRLAIFAATVAAAAMWLPDAVRQQTLGSLPLAKRAEIGATLLGHLQRIAGQTCRNELGTSALTTLRTRLFGEAAPGQIVVVPQAIPGALALPGGILVLSRQIIESTDDPGIVAGHILAAALSRADHDPLEPILRDAGFVATLTLLTTGNLPPGILETRAQEMMQSVPPLGTPDALAQGFAQAHVPFEAWIAASGRDAADMEPYRAASKDAETPLAPLLSDGSWISLQGICAG